MGFVFMDMWACRKYTKYIALADFIWGLILTLTNLIILIEYTCFIEENLLDGILNEDVTLLLLIIFSSFILLVQLIIALRLFNSSRDFDSSPEFCCSASRQWIITSYVFLGLQVVKILAMFVLFAASDNVHNRNSTRKYVFILLSMIDILFRAVFMSTVKLFYDKHVSVVQTLKTRPNAAVFKPLSAPIEHY